ncbi:MAG: YhdP family protein [Candidatus Thiodiazotropha taylori]|nr:TIGR02099 family protein [Candidatus Thiodiazotropha taylori]MCW4326890.1 YhdP family protein [Candidatus Thiodiazotropha taylori]
MLAAAKYIHTKFWQVIAWLVILLAVGLSLARFLLPGIDLEPYRQEIERVLEEKAEMPLSIGAIQAQLKGVHLVLKFADVGALDKQTEEPLLFAPEVYVRVQLLKSLLAGQLQLGGGKVVGTKLKMERFADGSFSLQGMERAGESSNTAAVLGIFLEQNRLRMVDTEILIKSALQGRPPLRLSGLKMDLLNNGLQHRLALSGRIGHQGEEKIELIADLRQSSADSMVMSGEFYMKCEDLQLGGRLGEWLPGGYQVDQGRANLELWGDVADGAVQRISGQSELHDLHLTGRQKDQSFSLQHLATSLDWSRIEAGWMLALEQFSLTQKGREWPEGGVEVSWWKSTEQGTGFELRADYLSLDTAHDLISIVELPARDLQNALLGLNPRGDLTGLDFYLQQLPGQEMTWQLQGEVEKFISNPWESIPGTAGLKMSFDGNQSGGWLKIDSDNLTIDYPQLFRRPLQADRVKGDFLWNFDLQSGLHMQTDHLEMSNPDMETLSRIELQIPISGKDLFADIQTDFWNADGSRKSEYLPVTVMPEGLVEWLDKSMVSGHVKSGSFLLYGPVSAFPFKAHEGRFEVWFGVEDLLLDYMPEWPVLSETVAEVHFINNGLKARLEEGVMLNSRLRDVSVEIDELRNPTPVKIRGEAIGPFKDIMAILGDTPLKEDFQPFVEAVSVGGKTHTVVDLAIPLEEGRGELSVEGAIDFQRAALRVKQADVDLKSITGEVKFDSSGVSGKKLQAQFLNEPVQFDIAPYRYQGRDWTRIKANSVLDLAKLHKKFPDWYLQYFKGRGRADLEFSIAHQPSRIPVRMNLSSQLVGVEVDLPAPLIKAPEVARELDLGVDFLSDSSTELRVLYGDDTHGLLRLYDDQEKPWVAAIGFQREPLSLDGVEGFHLSGQLDLLNADHWIAWVNRQAKQSDTPMPRIEMNLRVDELIALGTSCPQTRFTYKDYANGYRVNLTSDTVQGTMQVPSDLQTQPILGRFDFIKLDLDELASAITGEQPQTDSDNDLDPRDVPAINFSVDKLFINDRPIGKANLTWSKENSGITINNLTLIGHTIDLSGQGYWRVSPKGHSTGLNLHMKTPSLGDLQHHLGLTTGIEKAPTEVKAELYWPTSPLQMGAENLYGSIWLDVGKGAVDNVDPGVGRLIGLFSLNALGKRLALDFSDLFSKGMAFDTIQGNFVLNDGDAYTTDLALRSTAAMVDIRGRTGLSSRTYDQQVVVTPNVSATLPLVGALAINPTVGVALAVTQQLFGKHFDRIAMRTYEVTGSWDDPTFNQLSLEVDDEERDTHMPEMPGD